MPRPGRSDPLGARLVVVPAAWFDHRDRGYPALVGARLGAPPRLVAASVGTAAMVWAGDGPTPLLREGLAGDPGLVTVSFGANDALWFMARDGAPPAVTRWAGLLWRVPGGRRALRDRMPPDLVDRAVTRTGDRLAALLSHLGAPGRTVVVTTYPVGDGSEELRRRFTGPLNAAIRAAAARAGARLADLEPLFAGHDRTAPRRDRWISLIDGMHPTAAGHRRIAEEVLRAAAARVG